MKYDNLRNKTILDFTTDAEIIDELVGEPNLFLKNLTEQSRAFSLIYYAEYIDDKAMIAAVEKEFDEEFSRFFNE